MNSKVNFKIIIIDDNLAIHKDFMKILTTTTTPALDNLSSELFGKKNETLILPHFEIDTASQGQEGVERIKAAIKQGQPYALAFVDIRMPPGWDGIETIKHIWEIDKDIQIVICTAYSDYTWEETVAELGETDNLLILKKPFDNVSVRQLASALTKKWQLIQNARQYTDNLKQQVADKTLSLQTSLSLVKATLESSGDGILVINNEGNIIDYNQKFVDMWHTNINDENQITLLEQFKDDLEDPAGLFDRLTTLENNLDEISIDSIKFKDGRIFECYSQPHKLHEKTVGRVLDFRDITKRAKLEQELQHQATHDSLTGLPNRVTLLNRLQLAIKNSQAETKPRPFAVLFLDLDRFKLINDSLSHAVGDELLQAAAARLQSAIEPEDVLVRLGGDEFVIGLMNISNVENIFSEVQRILSAFQQPFYLGGRQMIVTVSIGISFYPKDGTAVDELLRNADAAMYRAKSLLGNNFQFYLPEMNTHSLAKLDQEGQLRQALANNEFFLVYQPQLDLSSEKLIAVEALLRWQHPEKGVLLPMDFIPVAEETGLIVPIGEWVIKAACKQNQAWHAAGMAKIRVAVSITAKQLQQQNITQSISDILRETGLKPEYLELELTENVIISNIDIANTIVELKQLGVTIALDNFGKEYSNLSYLQKVPLDRLKIDSLFIQHIRSANDDEIIIRAVIAMAKSLNLEVLAEGVETKNQLEFLQNSEAGDVQGFYFGKPLTQGEVEELFKNPTNMKKITAMIATTK